LLKKRGGICDYTQRADPILGNSDVFGPKFRKGLNNIGNDLCLRTLLYNLWAAFSCEQIHNGTERRLRKRKLSMTILSGSTNKNSNEMILMKPLLGRSITSKALDNCARYLHERR
jgi:hypothetical protein